MYATLALTTLAAASAASITQQPDWLPMLESIVDREVADKALPSFAIVVVDRDGVAAQVVRGRTDRSGGSPVSPATVYRTGSAGKTLTDLAILISAERGLVDLDADVRRYLPDFNPENPFGEPVTLRRLMVHTSGLVREPPVGSYFDASGPDLERTVASLNGTALLWEAGTRTKYSNAGLAVAGRVLEAVHGESYAALMRRLVFEPAGMKAAAVGRTAAVERSAARGVMRRPAGTDWPAPTFELGMSPAGDLYASIEDMASFMATLLSDDGRLLSHDMLVRMWTPEPPREDWQLDVGLGFSLNGRFGGGHRMARHGGAVYGFATELALLPEDGLGVYAVGARDLANGTVQSIAHWALLTALASRAGAPPPGYELTPAPFAGFGDRVAECTAGSGARQTAIAGMYGEAHNPLFLCWVEGRLHARIEWMFLYALEDVADEDVWRFPSHALYGHERLWLVRDAAANVIDAVIGNGRDGLHFRRR